MQRTPFLLCQQLLLDKKAPTRNIYLFFNKNHHPPPLCLCCVSSGCLGSQQHPGRALGRRGAQHQAEAGGCSGWGTRQPRGWLKQSHLAQPLAPGEAASRELVLGVETMSEWPKRRIRGRLGHFPPLSGAHSFFPKNFLKTDLFLVRGGLVVFSPSVSRGLPVRATKE